MVGGDRRACATGAHRWPTIPSLYIDNGSDVVPVGYERPAIVAVEVSRNGSTCARTSAYSTIALGWDKDNTGTKGNAAKTPGSVSILTTPIASLPHWTRYHADNQSSLQRMLNRHRILLGLRQPGAAVLDRQRLCPLRLCPRSSALLSSWIAGAFCSRQ